MPSAFLQFRLPEEAAEHLTAVHAEDYRAVLWEFDEWLRAQLKHGKISAAARTALQGARDELFALANAHDVEIGP